MTYCYNKSNNTLESITIPEGYTSIGDYAFENCSNLTSITIPPSVKEINSCAFRHCSNLSSITIPDSVTKIGDYAFCGCFNLSSITIPSSITKIDCGTFYSCPNLKSVIIPTSVTKINYDSFDYYNLNYLKISEYLYIICNLENYLNDECEVGFWNNECVKDYKNEYVILKNKFDTLLQAYKDISQKYPILFKEFEKEILRLDPDFEFE